MALTLKVAGVDQLPKVIDGSLTLKLNTLDFALKDPTTKPAIDDAVVFDLGISFTISVWSKQTAGCRQVHAKVEWLQADGVTLSAIHAVDYFMGGTDGLVAAWTQHSQTGTVPADARFARISLLAGWWDGVSGSNAQCWFDDLSFSLETIADTSFEDADIAGVRNSWSLSGVSGDWSLDATTAHSGSKSLKNTTTRTTASTWEVAQPLLTPRVYPAWGGLVTEVGGADPTDRIGHNFVTVSASNQNEAIASAAPFNLSDAPNKSTTFGYSDLKVKTTKARDGTLTLKGSCSMRQPGLWPGMTFKLTSTNQGISAQDFTVTNLTLRFVNTHGTPTPLFALEFGDPIVTMSVWINQQIASATDSLFPIDGTKITDGAITTPKLYANAVTGDKIHAGTITADLLAATLILGSLIQAGVGNQRVELDAGGLRAYDPDGHQIIKIPSDGSDVTIAAHIIASTLSVIGTASFLGSFNELALNTVLQLNAYQQNPNQAPMLSQTWDSISLPVDSNYDKDASHYSRSCIFYDSAGGADGATKTFWTVTQKADGSHEYMLELKASDRTVLRAIDLGPGGVGPGTTPYVNPLGVARLGSYLYLLSVDKYSGAGGSANLGQTGGASGWYCIGYSGGPNEFAMGPYTMPEHGTLQSVTVDCGSDSGSCGFMAVLWRGSDGAYITNSGWQYPGVGHSPVTFPMPAVDLPAGSTYFIGVYADNGGSKRIGTQNAGSLHYKSNQGGISAMSGYSEWYYNGHNPPTDAGNMQAYLTYSRVTAYTEYKVRRWIQSSLGLDAIYQPSYPVSTPNSPQLTADGTYLYIVDRSTDVVWNKYDGAMVQQGSTINTGYNPGTYVFAAYAGSADYGAWRMVIVAGASGSARTYDATGANQSAEGFEFQSTPSGLSYGDALGDGARFWSQPQIVNTTAKNLTKHSTWTWGWEASIFWVGYSWPDTNATGGTHDTGISPRASITLSRRAKLSITAQDYPGSGGPDDPNNINFFVVQSGSDPGPGNFKRQAQQTNKTLVLSGYNSGGAADITNNYPSGSAATLKSQALGWSFKGDGTFSQRFRAGAYRSAALSLGAAAFHVLEYDAIAYDPNSNFDITTHKGRYTCPVAGKYLVTAGFQIATTPCLVACQFYVNGVAARYPSLIGGSANTGYWGGGSAIVECNAGDYIEVAAYLSTGQGLLVGASINYVDILYTGD